MHYNTLTKQEANELPNHVIINGKRINNPTSEQYAAAGWIDLVPFETPAGMVNNGDASIEVVDGVAYKSYATITIEEYEAQLTDAQRNRILGLTDAYGADIAIMGRLLALFGYSFPCDAATTIATIKGGLATGAIGLGMASDAATLKELYDQLSGAMTDDEMAAVAAILQWQQA